MSHFKAEMGNSVL